MRCRHFGALFLTKSLNAGMFLLAKLVMMNLLSKISRGALFEELNVKGIPNGLEEA